jgi:hypothetical protein
MPVPHALLRAPVSVEELVTALNLDGMTTGFRITPKVARRSVQLRALRSGVLFAGDVCGSCRYLNLAPYPQLLGTPAAR